MFTMSSSTLTEVFGHIVFSFTRSVTARYNPEEPEFTAESFGYNPLESTGREWYYHPVEELIYQEYSDSEATSSDHLASRNLNVRVVDACSPVQENEKAQEDQQNEDRAMAWKQLRPPVLRSVCKSMYFAALISLLTAASIGTFYLLISYLCFTTKNRCEYHSTNPIPTTVQWLRTISCVILYGFLYFWYFSIMLCLFRPFQLTGVKKILFLVCFLLYCLDALYRVALQALGKSHSKPSRKQQIPLSGLFLLTVCLQLCVVTNHFGRQSRRHKLALFFQIMVPGCLPLIVGSQLGEYFLYPTYNRFILKGQLKGQLLFALFTPLIGVFLKVISRICVQQFYNITHPGYSYTLLSPLYFGSALIFRVLQADLHHLPSIVILGIIHGAGEVIERSAMVVIDHICHLVWKRTLAPWGKFSYSTP